MKNEELEIINKLAKVFCDAFEVNVDNRTPRQNYEFSMEILVNLIARKLAQISMRFKRPVRWEDHVKIFTIMLMDRIPDYLKHFNEIDEDKNNLH